MIGKALNAKETMELLQREEIDLLLLDNYLPDGIGTDLLPKIHADFPNVDVIMVTAANENHMLKSNPKRRKQLSYKTGYVRKICSHN